MNKTRDPFALIYSYTQNDYSVEILTNIRQSFLYGLGKFDPSNSFASCRGSLVSGGLLRGRGHVSASK